MTEVWQALPEARIVGGAVRDMLAGRPVFEVDFAVPLPPAAVIARAEAAGLKAVPTGLAHGTITVIAAQRGFEVTTLRRDIETDGRHAVVEFTDNWEVDASRRDFTINAMSLTQAGEVFDYFNGRRDLGAGRVRFVGDAATRISEDYLRILRFFRFFARYGRGDADGGAMAAITRLRQGVLTLSVERVWHELKAILSADDPRSALALMRRAAVLELVLPEADLSRLNALVERGAPAHALLRVAALGTGDVAGFADQWRLSGAERARLTALTRGGRLTPEGGDAVLRRALASEEAAILIERSWLEQDDGPGWPELRARLAAIKCPVFPLHGRDLTKLGVPPGPQIGGILKKVNDWWVEGGCVASAAACRDRMRIELNLAASCLSKD